MDELKGKKIAMLTEDGFEEIELANPKEVLEQAGATVLIVSPQNGKVKSKAGEKWSKEYAVDLTLEDADVETFDALILPGGVINPDKLRTNKLALGFVNSFLGLKNLLQRSVMVRKR